MTVDPPRELLPGRLGDLGVDLLARKAGEAVVVQIKRQPHLASPPRLDHLAREIDAQPGWRLDLVVLGRRPPDKERLLATILGREEIAGRIASAEGLLDSGDKEAALLLMWSAVEAALRRRAAEENAPIRDRDPVDMLNRLHFDGLLTTDQYFTLRDIAESRNAVVHGLKSKPIDRRVVVELAEIARGALP